MQAAVLRQYGARLSVLDLKLGRPLPDEVVVRVVASGLCHSDGLAQRGDSPRARALPLVLGHEAAGIIELVGERVSTVCPGDRVVACAAAFCGMCEWCQRGLQQHCESTSRSRPAGSPPRLSLDGTPVDAFVGLGAFASQMLIHERAVIRVPDDMPLDRAALLGCAVHTGFGAVRHTANVSLGESVTVVGCGGVGLNIVQAARMAGASKVVAVDLRQSALERATAFGATATVDASAGYAVEMVRELTDGGTDHVFEVVGRPETVEQACAMARTRGAITIVGLPRPGDRIQVPADEFFSEKKLQGSKMGSQFRRDIPWYCEMYLAGRLMLDELISERISLDEINDGMQALGQSELARSIVVF